MRKLELVSNPPPTHQYKKAAQEHLAIPNLLALSTLLYIDHFLLL
ncbi:hypothetical protein [Candidatus Regiella insecticola]|nr:hypothetical protein [Candidatus Regiella insecticola]